MVINGGLSTVWLASRGSILKCARAHVRAYTDDDLAARELVEEDMVDAAKELAGGQASYEDLTGQEGPEEDGPPRGGQAREEGEEQVGGFAARGR